MRPAATIIVDASHCPETLVGGYGYRISSDLGFYNGGGELKDKSKTSTCAEMKGIVNSLHFAIKKGFVKFGNKVLIQCDCTAALDALRGLGKIRHDGQKDIKKHFNYLCDRFDLIVEFRHVKGHSSQNGSRYLANKIADKTAKKHMRNSRSKYRTEKLTGEL